MTAPGDRYFVGPRGYFIELPGASLAAINPRVAFPAIHWFPSLTIGELRKQPQYGDQASMITVAATGVKNSQPQAVPIDSLVEQLQELTSFDALLNPFERYMALRVYESGMVSEMDLRRVIAMRGRNETFGQILINQGLSAWEILLGLCMDMRQVSRLDPPEMRAMAARKEWELTGEILISMGKVTRTDLESALQMKREGSRALGEILTSMGACSQEDIEQALGAQKEIRGVVGSGVALIGQLLVSRGVISSQDLEDAIRSQKVGRHSLQRILISMGACSERDIEDFERSNDWHSFQDEIDDVRLGHWLLKVGTITRQQFEEALRIQERGRQVLGELLISLRLCSADDIEIALATQRQVREDYRSGVEKLGALLVKRGRVDANQLEQAIKMQSTARQRIGCILVALGACKEDDVRQALEVQRHWRQMTASPGDRLGDVLLRQGVIERPALERAVERHLSDKVPLGRVLVEDGTCTPEEIISCLISRDEQRKTDFRAFVKQRAGTAAAREPAVPPAGKPGRAGAGPSSVISRLSSWISRRK